MQPTESAAADTHLPPSAHLRVRISASSFFLLDGMIFGTWAALIPSFKSKLDLDEGQLGIVLFGMVAGALFSMPLAGQAIARHGSRRLLTLLAPAFCLALCLLALAPSFLWLVAAALFFGAFKGALDVTINAQAIRVENAGPRPIMSTFHALWSIGGLVAALLVSLALKLRMAPFQITLVVAVLLALLSFTACRRLLGGDASQAPSGFRFKPPNPRLLRIGLLAGMALFAEGVLMDWSSVYSKTVAGADDWLAPLAYGVFSFSMAAGRLTGDRVTARFGSSGVLRASGFLTTAGLLLMVLLHHWPATFAGLALAGLGLSNLVPVFFGAGGRAHEESAGKGIAAVSTLGYLGFLAGPPVIGGISHFIGLPAAFFLVVLLALFIAIRGNHILQSAASGPRP